MRRMQPTPLQQKVVNLAGEIEAEMRRIGMWTSETPSPDQMDFNAAFAMDTMPFSWWLQFVFLPRVHEAAASNKFPSSSSVATQAVREFDGDPNANRLLTLLSEFDALFG